MGYGALDWESEGLAFIHLFIHSIIHSCLLCANQLWKVNIKAIWPLAAQAMVDMPGHNQKIIV